MGGPTHQGHYVSPTRTNRGIVDFDGDGKTDIAVYHSASGLWFIKPSSGAADYYVGYGGPDYNPVPGDYDGDRKTDVAVYHSPSGLWYIKKSSDGADYYVGYGGPDYKPVPGDYDGDGKTDIAVYHFASGLWFIKKSSDGGSFNVAYGGPGYDPVLETLTATGRRILPSIIKPQGSGTSCNPPAVALTTSAMVGPVMFLSPGTTTAMERPTLQFIILPPGSGLLSLLRVQQIIP